VEHLFAKNSQNIRRVLVTAQNTQNAKPFHRGTALLLNNSCDDWIGFLITA